MALKVWLPLNDSLYTNDTVIKQLGISDSVAIPSSSGITRKWYGKTGPCRSFTTGGYIGLDAPNVNNHKYSPITISGWMYFPVTDGTERYIINCFESGGCGFTWQNQQVSFVFYAGGYKYCRSQTVPLNEWHHFCATYDNTQALLYVDGILQTTLAATGPITYNSTCPWEIGGNPGATAWGSGNLTADLNDIRIYNHCLNVKEVKEISEGLIIQYKFHGIAGGIGSNLVLNSNWQKSNTTPPSYWGNWGSPPTREIVTINGKKWLHVISNTTQFQGYSQNWNQRSIDNLDDILPNTQYTVSFTAYASEASTLAPIGIHWCNSSGTIISQNWATTNLTTQPTRYSYTYTTPANCSEFNIMAGDSTATAHEIWITDIKLERGSIATSWCPATCDWGADPLGDQWIEANCAPIGMNLRSFTGWSTAYAPNATAYNGYSLSISDNQYIDTDSNPVSLEALTVAWRGYSDNWADLANLTSLVKVANSTFSIRNNKILLSVDEGDSEMRTVTSTVNASSLNGAWHHFVGTYDGATLCLYIDGVLNISQTFSPQITGANVWIGITVDEDNAPILA